MIIKEHISFTRNSSKEAIKTNLFGLRPGQIVAQVGQRDIISVFVIEYIVDSKLPEIEVTVMGLGYIYYLNYRGPNDAKEKWFDFTGGLSTSLIDRENIRPITEEEEELIRKAIQKDPQKFEDKKKQFAMRSDSKILFEDFQRGLSSREIKDKLVGFRPGQLFTYDKEWAKQKPFKEVYMFVKKAKGEEYNYDDGTPIIACYIGALSQRDGKLSQFLARNKKILGTVNLWQEEKRGLTEEEIEKVKKTFSELPGYLKKITEETGLVPSLKESLEFKRGSSDREIKEKLLGWRPGQILIINDTAFRRLMAFAGMEEKSLFPDPTWVIRCMEIGHISGDPILVYIHFGFTEDILVKRKPDLRLPTEEEAIVIQKAMKKPDYEKYIKKAEEKIGARLFV